MSRCSGTMAGWTLAVAALLLAAPLVAASTEDVRTFYLQPGGQMRDEQPESMPQKNFERAGGDPAFVNRATLATPLALTSASTFRVALPDRTALVDGSFATTLRVLHLHPDGSPVVLGEATFTTSQLAGESDAANEGWRQMALAFDAALLGDDETSYVVPEGHAIQVEIHLAREGSPKSLHASWTNDARPMALGGIDAADEATPPVTVMGWDVPMSAYNVARATLGATTFEGIDAYVAAPLSHDIDGTYRADVLPAAGVVFDAVEPGATTPFIGVNGVSVLRSQLEEGTTFRGLDALLANPAPVSYFTLGDADAPATFEIRA